MILINNTSKGIKYELYGCQKEPTENQTCEEKASQYVPSKKSGEITAPGTRAFYMLKAIHKQEFGWFVETQKGSVADEIYLNYNCLATSSEKNEKIYLATQGCGKRQ
ncbi:MAG TPA: hypothetical protein QF353_03350 [Gammaproteobacteria bacterium]|nr:hypothetical protein [Gammaproteobacteria bacterium]